MITYLTDEQASYDVCLFTASCIFIFESRPPQPTGLDRGNGAFFYIVLSTLQLTMGVYVSTNHSSGGVSFQFIRVSISIQKVLTQNAIVYSA